MERKYENRFEDRISLEGSDSLTLTADTRSEGTVIVQAEASAKDITLEIDARPDSKMKLLLVNGSEEEIRLKIHADVKSKAEVEFGLLDLHEKGQNLQLDADLLESGASFDLTTAMLCLQEQRKDSQINITNHAPHTYGTMRNFAVCFTGGIYNMAAAGRIDDKCHDSESHQQTRVLTMERNHKVTVIPILYIDENEVKASHALTIGQPDASQLYYLQSRGLSQKQAIGLLAIGYFKPVIDMVGDEALHDTLRGEMERRVGLYEH